MRAELKYNEKNILEVRTIEIKITQQRMKKVASSPVEVFGLSIVVAQAAVLHLLAVHYGDGERTFCQ